MNDHLVSVNAVVKSFDVSEPPAIDGITTTLNKGEIVGLAGPDGAGKTTLIRLLAGLLKPTQGTITIAGCDTIREAAQIPQLIGYMPQKFGLYEDLTVMQNMTLYADLGGITGEKRIETFKKLLDFTSLAPFTDRYAEALSGGMKQKLGLACALMRKPTLLLLDEPTVGVDPLSRRELWKMIQALVKEGIAVVWSTAYLEEVEKCHRVLLLNEGKLLYQGSPQDVTKRVTRSNKRPSFEDAFMDMLGGEPDHKSVLAEITPQVQGKGEIVIEADHLTKRFGTFVAADNISFQVPRGEIFGLLGPNGAGKSTTFKMMCGLLTPSEGQAFVNHLDLQKAPSEARAHIGYMAQKFSLYGDLNVLQNLEFFSGIYNLTGRRQKDIITKMIEIFNLQHYLHVRAGTLPLGYKQRLALSCAHMHNPEVLFLDEPTAGVDPITRREFWIHIKGLVDKGVTVMVTTHFLDEAEYCDRVALIYQGQIINMGTPETMKEAARTPENPTPTLEDAFIQLIEKHDADKLRQHKKN